MRPKEVPFVELEEAALLDKQVASEYREAFTIFSELDQLDLQETHGLCAADIAALFHFSAELQDDLRDDSFFGDCAAYYYGLVELNAKGGEGELEPEEDEDEYGNGEDGQGDSEGDDEGEDEGEDEESDGDDSGEGDDYKYSGADAEFESSNFICEDPSEDEYDEGECDGDSDDEAEESEEAEVDAEDEDDQDEDQDEDSVLISE